jgi:DNA adenine methylase
MSAAPDMKISAIAPWFGGKRTLAPTIIEELGKHAVYWEPFCGSMAVLLSKPQSRMETVNDLHGDLTNLARTIQHPFHGPRFYRHLRRTWFSEGAYQLANSFLDEGESGDEIDPERAYHYFIKSWMGRNGTSGLADADGCSNFCVRYTPKGGDPGVRFRNVVETIPAWRRRLRGVTILRRDAFAVIDKIHDEPGTAVYLDPPYLIKGSRYKHDFNDGFMGVDNDHERLAAALARFKKARIVVSYYEHPALRQLYAGWTCRAVHTNKHTANAGVGAGGTVAPEVLLINGPSLAKVVA